jgi:hypothetical protein
MEIDPNVVIRRLGGTSAAARICEIEPASVSNWKKNGIPKPWIKFLRLAFPEAFIPVIESQQRDTSTT